MYKQKLEKGVFWLVVAAAFVVTVVMVNMLTGCSKHEQANHAAEQIEISERNQRETNLRELFNWIRWWKLEMTKKANAVFEKVLEKPRSPEAMKVLFKTHHDRIAKIEEIEGDLKERARLAQKDGENIHTYAIALQEYFASSATDEAVLDRTVDRTIDIIERLRKKK